MAALHVAAAREDARPPATGKRPQGEAPMSQLAIGNITTLATLPRGYLRRAAWAAARRAIGTRNGEQLT